jgi:hypothetical protein
MVHRRRAIETALAVAVVCSVGLVAQKKDDKKQDEAQKKEVQAVVKVADEVAAGQPAANDLGLSLMREDYLKAQGSKEYVPFVVTIDPSKVAGGSIVFYWRVVSKNAAAPAAPAAGAKDDKKDKDKDKKAKAEFAYEDVSFLPMPTAAPAVAATTVAAAVPGTPAAAATSPMRIAGSFTVPAGAYDLFVVAKELTSSQKNAPAPKVSVLKQSVNVPDFWNGELNTSTVLIAQRIDPLPAPLTPVQQKERPYALGQMEIVPQLELTFSKKADLSTLLLIYNPKADAGNKPDVIVEYSFYQKQAGAEKFFNKTNPTNLNTATLPPQFDMAVHQLQAGQAVPLASFPEGDYRLEIKITDKIANKTLTRDVNFTVTAS